MVTCFYSPPSNVLVNSSPTPSPQIRIIFLLQFSLLKRLLYNSRFNNLVNLTYCVCASFWSTWHKCTKWSELLNSICMYCLNYQLKSKPSRALGAGLIHRVFWCTPCPFFFFLFFPPSNDSISLVVALRSLCFLRLCPWLMEIDWLHITPSILNSCLQTLLSDWVALEIIHQNLLIFKIFVLRIQSVYIPLYLYVYTVYFLDIWTTVTGSHK